MKKLLKQTIQTFLKKRGKRITNLNAPAKSFEYGVEFLKNLFTSTPDCIIDIGVADGTPELLHSFPYAQNKYLLIEANPLFFNYLESVKADYPQTIIEKVFCGETETTTNFFLSKTGRSASRYNDSDSHEKTTVPIRTLDDIILKNNIEGKFFLKIDVENAEIDVLKGALNTLPKCEVVIIETWINKAIENEERDFASIVAFMKDNSFVVFDFFGGHSYRSGVLHHVDVVFVKKNSEYRQKR